MFKHILIPTDGSRLASKGVKAGVKLAKALGARVTGVYVIPPFIPAPRVEGAYDLLGNAMPQYKQASERAAKKALAAIQIEAETAGVPYASRFTTDPQPWGGLLRVARSRRCDAIAMASHGRGGLGRLLLGSETQRVLAHSRIPVLVVR